MKKIALCPGTYDPMTEGHRDVVLRCSKVFDKVIVAVSNNIRKKTLSGLLVDVAKESGAGVIVKGLRAISDFEYEFQMAQINKKLSPELETMFLVTNPKFAYLSSSAVKEVAKLKGCISGLVPKEIELDIIESFEKKFFN